MNFDTQQALDKLRQAVNERVFEGYTAVTQWQDYDVMVCERADESARHWSMLPPVHVHEFRRREPHRRIVATRYASELAWLFDELRKIHPDESERHTYHDFYAELADAANLYIEKAKSGATATGLLERILDKVRDIYR